MSRQSITFSEPNDSWLKEQVESKEYSSKSEVVNDLIRQARGKCAELDWLRAKIDRSIAGKDTTRNKEEILALAKSRLKQSV
jgi:antitoxin ParD1/3/4